MQTDFTKLKRKDVSDQALSKFKWKTIQYLLEKKRDQIDVLTRDLKALMQEVKDQRKVKREEEERKRLLNSRKGRLHLAYPF